MPTTADSKFAAIRPVLSILIGASLMLSLAMGLRQSLGIFMPNLTKDIGISVSDFTLAVAVQNLGWGVLQPLAGALVVRIGYKRLMLLGAALYVVGLILLSMAHGMFAVLIGAGIALGMSMACVGPAEIELTVQKQAEKGQRDAECPRGGNDRHAEWPSIDQLGGEELTSDGEDRYQPAR